MKSGLKAGILLQFDQQENNLEDVVQKGFEAQKRQLLAKESIRVLKWEKKQGQNGDDFAQNKFSVLFTGKGYKVSRIVKRLFK